jgi:hypothetical protein
MLLCQSLPPPLRSIKPAASRPAQERKPKKKLKENIDPVVEADDFVTEADDFGSIPIFSDDEVSRVENVPVYCEPEADTLGKRKAATVPDQPTSLSRRPELGEKLTAKPVSKQPKAIYSMPSSSLDEDRSVGEESPPRRPSGPIISKKRKSAPRPLSKISTKKTKTSERLLSSSPPAFDDISTVQGGMGQQLIPRQSPQHKTIAKTKSPPIIKAVMPKPAPKKKVQERAPLGQESPAPILTTKGLKTRKKKSIEQNPPIEEPAPSASPAGKPGKPKKVTKTTVRKAAATAVSITSTHSASPMVPSPRYITIPDSPLSERSPSLSPSLQTPSLPASRSVSPHKVPFSAGGFRRKKNKKTATPVPETDIPNPVRRAPVLPPPFATNKRMGEKGLGELERPLKSARLEDDPIEDEDQPIEPVRNTRNANRFRRIRSTSDMLDEPIPSASKEWEYNNLSRATLELENTAIVSGPAPAPAVGNKLKATNGLAALVKKTDPRKKFQRAQSLNVATSFKRAPTPDIPSPPPDTDVGPWSTEAFDLLGWRPPNREDDMDMDEDADAW